METLEGSKWDVVIAGTGIRESLLALALSRSGKQILHVDNDDKYGGHSAALNLAEAETWVKQVNEDVNKHPFIVFRNASITTGVEQISFERGEVQTTRLKSPSDYYLALAPELIYARSALISAFVSSRIEEHLDFLAMGSWWVYTPHGKSSFQMKLQGLHESQENHQIPNLKKVPNGREDLLHDESLVSRSRRSLVKFIRFVVNFEEKQTEWESRRQEPFIRVLQDRFGLSGDMLDGIQALAMSSFSPYETTTEYALPRVARHLRSIGVFGQGFGAIIPKYGGLSEVSQVACRALAVGGGVHCLGNGVKEAFLPGTFEQEVKEGENAYSLKLKLAEGDTVFANCLVGSQDNVPSSLVPDQEKAQGGDQVCFSRSVSIVSSLLEPLFPPLGEESQPPTGAVVVVPGSILAEKADVESTPPVHIIFHSSDTGECPKGQCVLYASTAAPSAFSNLTTAIDLVLASVAVTEASIATALQSLSLGNATPESKSAASHSSPSILWSMQYEQRCPKMSAKTPSERVHRVDGSKDKVMVFEPEGLDLVFEDEPVLEGVKEAWRALVGLDGAEADEAGFMKFAPRGGEVPSED